MLDSSKKYFEHLANKLPRKIYIYIYEAGKKILPLEFYGQYQGQHCQMVTRNSRSSFGIKLLSPERVKAYILHCLEANNKGHKANKHSV